MSKPVKVDTKGLQEIAVCCPYCNMPIWLVRDETGRFANPSVHYCRHA